MSVSFNVSFMCQACKVIFKSVEMYCSHKLEFHFTQLKKFRCIVFKESIVEPTDTASLNFGTSVVVPQCKEFVTDELQDKITVDVKHESQEKRNQIAIYDTVSSSSINKQNLLDQQVIQQDPVMLLELKYSADYADGTSPCLTQVVNIPPTSDNFNESNYFDDARSSAKSPIVQVDVDLIGDKQVENRGHDHDPLEDFDDETQFETESMPTRITEPEMEYLNEKICDSDDDIICSDDPLSPTASCRVPSSTITTAPTTILNNLASPKLSLNCKLCSKPFTSVAQLGIHFSICQLYNSEKTKRTSTKPEPGPVSDVNIVIKEKRERQRDERVKCGNCSQLIGRRNFKRHVISHQILVPDKDALTRFVCQICGSAFRSKNYLEAHEEVHSKETPFKCFVPNCDAAFSLKSSFYRHLKSHTHSDSD